MENILLVEDDQNLGVSLKKVLESEGMQVDWAQSKEQAKQKVEEKNKGYHLIVLDWMLPDGQGIDFLKTLRKNKLTTPVIMLTARTELVDKVLGLESGANDYLTKPFEPRELVARIRVQLRDQGKAAKGADEEVIKSGGLEIDTIKREVSFEGKVIEMTKMEYELIKLLAESPGRAYSREEILNKVWGYDNYPTTRTVDTHVLQLRQKLSDDLIETIRGVGYRLKMD